MNDSAPDCFSKDGNWDLNCLKLPVAKAELIEFLFASFDNADRKRIDGLWANEAESRIDAYEKGQIPAKDVQSVFDRINAQ